MLILILKSLRCIVTYATTLNCGYFLLVLTFYKLSLANRDDLDPASLVCLFLLKQLLPLGYLVIVPVSFTFFSFLLELHHLLFHDVQVFVVRISLNLGKLLYCLLCGVIATLSVLKLSTHSDFRSKLHVPTSI